MTAGSMESSSRSHSLTSSAILGEKTYDNVDLTQLYEAVLKLVVLEYMNEVRFRTPIITQPTTQEDAKPSNRTNSSSTLSRYYRSSKYLDVDPPLPTYLISNIEKTLNLIAMKKYTKQLDEPTRRSLLRLYSEFLDPCFKQDLIKNNTPEYIVMKFVSCANKELVKIGNIPSHEISEQVFTQAENFVSILIDLIKKDKESDALIAKLKENKDALKPTNRRKSMPSISADQLQNATYANPSFKITDMDQSLIRLVMKLFGVDSVKVQQDIIRIKDISSPKCLHQDINQALFYLDKDIGHYSKQNFMTTKAYQDWKAREISSLEQLKNKYKISPNLKLLPVPSLPKGGEYYLSPPRSFIVPYLVVLGKLCIAQDQNVNGESIEVDGPLLSKTTKYVLNLAARIWRVDVPTRCTSLYTASHLSGVLKQKSELPNSLVVETINLTTTIKVLHSCKKVIEDGNMDWDQKESWAIRDQDDWVKNLTCSYNEVMFAIKDNLALVVNRTQKPAFTPFLMLLGDYVESDSLFTRVEESGLPKKWEKKLSKSLLKTAELRYAELLSRLPRDDTLNIGHVLEISDDLVADIKLLQKRYKNPLLGVLNVSQTVAAVVTSMFAVDARNILKHIDAYSQSKDEFIPYADALEAYKSMSEIRYIHSQVASKNSEFKFKLEGFFYKYLAAWVEESGDKIMDIVQNALKSEEYKPIDIYNDDRKYSHSILDIFKLVKEFFNILKGLNWKNEFQLAQSYTHLLKGISDASMYYASSVSEKIMKDLDVDRMKKSGQTEAEIAERRKNGGWFDEMKSVVSSMNTGLKIEIQEPYKFLSDTCVSLNNLSALMGQLAKLEDMIDPERISQTVAVNNPSSLKQYTSHVFSIKLVKAENLRTENSIGNINPYVTLIDTKSRKTIGKTRALNSTANPEWDEEFEVTLSAHDTLAISATIWDRRFGTHCICGRALIQLDPRRFKHDGIPEEIYLDLDTHGRILIEVAVESERLDAIFVMGRAHRSISRYQERCIKQMVEKFSKFVHYCFSRSNLKTICGSNGNIRPTQEQMDSAMGPLYEYLNMGLRVLAEYLTNELLLKVMLEAWNVVLTSADKLLLPNLATARSVQTPTSGKKVSSAPHANSGWQSAVTSAVANVTNSIMGEKPLSHIELETVFSWLNFLCLDFFHNGGHGPAVKDLKNEHYQSLLLIPIYYDSETNYLLEEVERLSPAYLKTLQERNNLSSEASSNSPRKVPGGNFPARKLSRATSIMRTKTISANATSKARAQAAKDAQEAKSDPTAIQIQTEDILLRILIVRGEKDFVSRRLDHREKLARTLTTERLARAAAESRYR